MGSSESKEEQDNAQQIERTEINHSTLSKANNIENSSGFHLIEIHVPSMGYSIFFIGVILVIFLAWRYRKRAQKKLRTERQRQCAALLQLYPHQYQHQRGIQFLRDSRAPPSSRALPSAIHDLPTTCDNGVQTAEPTIWFQEQSMP